MSADPGNDCRPSDAVKNLSVVLSDIIRSGRHEGNNFIAKTYDTLTPVYTYTVECTCRKEVVTCDTYRPRATARIHPPLPIDGGRAGSVPGVQRRANHRRGEHTARGT